MSHKSHDHLTICILLATMSNDTCTCVSIVAYYYYDDTHVLPHGHLDDDIERMFPKISFDGVHQYDEESDHDLSDPVPAIRRREAASREGQEPKDRQSTVGKFDHDRRRPG